MVDAIVVSEMNERLSPKKVGAVPYPKEALNDAWKRFLWHQFHDDLTGTSIWEAYTCLLYTSYMNPV